MYRRVLLCMGIGGTLLFSAQARENNLTAKIRAGYFHLTSDLTQKLYRHGGADFEVEFGARFHEDLSVWVNFNVFRRDGKTVGFCDPASLHVYPLSTGLLYNFAADSIVSPYLGIGVSYSFIKIHGEPPTVRNYLEQGTWGAVGKGGLLLAVTENLFLDLFTDYYYTKPSVEWIPGQTPPIPFANNVGGIRLGLGIGCNF